MLNFDKRRVLKYEKTVILEEASMDWISSTERSNDPLFLTRNIK